MLSRTGTWSSFQHWVQCIPVHRFRWESVPNFYKYVNPAIRVSLMTAEITFSVRTNLTNSSALRDYSASKGLFTPNYMLKWAIVACRLVSTCNSNEGRWCLIFLHCLSFFLTLLKCAKKFDSREPQRSCSAVSCAHRRWALCLNGHGIWISLSHMPDFLAIVATIPGMLIYCKISYWMGLKDNLWQHLSEVSM